MGFNFLCCRFVDTEKTIYQLVGIIQHIGTPRGGHDFAYVRVSWQNGGSTEAKCGSSKSWFYASVEHIREACLDEVLRIVVVRFICFLMKGWGLKLFNIVF
jgi:ubiquitin carboxyl-terminal hydrolase 16/45